MLNENENGRKQGIRSGHTVLTFCTTWDKGCRIFFDNELLMPGEVTTGYLVFLREVPISEFFFEIFKNFFEKKFF